MHPADFPPTFLQIRNQRTGKIFNVRLVRIGEMYGRQWVVRHDKSEPLLIFHHAPDEPGGRLRKRDRDGKFLGAAAPAYHAHLFLSDARVGLSLYGNGSDITPENCAEIRVWLKAELSKSWTELAPPPPPLSRKLIESDLLLPGSNDRRMTIYISGGFGWRKMEVKWVEIFRMPYAQFRNAHEVRFLPKRKKYPRKFTVTTDPHFVIVLGWNHFDPRVGFEATKTLYPGRAVTIHTSRYTAFDKSYEVEFEDDLDRYLHNNELVTVVADFRDFKAKDGRWGQNIKPEAELVFSSKQGIIRQYIPTRPHESSVDLSVGQRFIFISYHHSKEAPIRRQIEKTFEKGFLSTSIYPGEVAINESHSAIQSYIRRRIATCDFFVCLIGEETHSRYWVDWELYVALALLKEGQITCVVAVFRNELSIVLNSLRAIQIMDVDDTKVVAIQDRLFREHGCRIPLRIITNVVCGAIKAVTLEEFDGTAGGSATLKSVAKLVMTGRRPVRQE